MYQVLRFVLLDSLSLSLAAAISVVEMLENTQV